MAFVDKARIQCRQAMAARVAKAITAINTRVIPSPTAATAGAAGM